MPRLTKQQKYERLLREYLDAMERIELRIYGENIDVNGNYHASYRGYPQGYPWTQAYGKRRKRRRRLCIAVRKGARRG